MSDILPKVKNAIVKTWEFFKIGYIISHKRSYFSMINAMMKDKKLAVQNINKLCPRCGNSMVVLSESPKYGFCASYIQTKNCSSLVIAKINKDGDISYKIV